MILLSEEHSKLKLLRISLLLLHWFWFLQTFVFARMVLLASKVVINICHFRDEAYDVLAVADWGQRLSFYQLSGKQVMETSFHLGKEFLIFNIKKENLCQNHRQFFPKLDFYIGMKSMKTSKDQTSIYIMPTFADIMPCNCFVSFKTFEYMHFNFR